MKVLVIGSGGREHAIIKSLSKSSKVKKIYAANGNAGIAELAKCVDIAPTDLDSICDFAKSEKIDFAVVAPDNPLAMGLVDRLEKIGIKAFGPSKLAAEIEASKVFSKNLMQKYNIPTAKYGAFFDFDSAVKYLSGVSFPIVIKADGLAFGKGVIICQNFDEAKSALKSMMLEKVFGSSGNSVIIEEFLIGDEVSVLVFTDGNTYKTMVTSCDHKRALDGDLGLNTGGMGTFSPCPFYDNKIEEEVNKNIIEPTIAAMKNEGRKFKGVLYFGLIKTSAGMKVIEYNARFGDPETQVILPMLKTDLMDIFLAVQAEKLDKIDIEWEKGSCVCVMLASGGYPEKYQSGKAITIEKIDDNIEIYHSGTKILNGKLVTAGGRVLGVCAKDKTLEKARESAYKQIEKISFEDMHFRTDIGKKFF